MEASSDANCKQNAPLHLQHLKLKGLHLKTVEAYSRAIRRIGERFDRQIDNLSEQQLADYFTELVPLENIVGSMNATLRGWVNHFHYRNSSGVLEKARMRESR